MLKESQDFRYVEIDKNLNTADSTVIIAALNDLDELLLQLTDRSLINTMVLRLIRIMSTVNQHYVKSKAMSVLARHPSLISSSINKQEVINSITHQLQSHDKLTKLLNLRLIECIPIMFKDELSTYHQLLSKLGEEDSQVVATAYKCLRNILKLSHNLSAVFCNNIHSIAHSHNTCIVVRLCLHLNLNSKHYLDLVRTLWPYVKQDDTSTKLYFRLISKASLRNFQAAMFYLQTVYPIKSIKYQYELVNAICQQYPFIKSINPAPRDQRLQTESYSVLLDQLYRRHHTDKLSQQDVNFVDDLIKNNISQCCNEHVLLLCYYSATSYDHIIAEQFKDCTDMRLLNMLIVLAYPISALCIIERLLNTDATHALYSRLIHKMNICLMLKQYSDLLLLPKSPFVQALTKYCYAIQNQDVHSACAIIQSSSDQYTQMLLCTVELYLKQCTDVTVYRQLMVKHVPRHRVYAATSIRELMLSAVYIPKHILLSK